VFADVFTEEDHLIWPLQLIDPNDSEQFKVINPLSLYDNYLLNPLIWPLQLIDPNDSEQFKVLYSMPFVICYYLLNPPTPIKPSLSMLLTPIKPT
jgi:hypothetical protein